MDVLYLVGPDSGHDNRELRWSLRSLARFAANLGHVVVAGYPPSWLAREVVRVPIDDNPVGLSKFRYIWKNCFAAIDSGAVSGEFLVSGDDHFYSAPVDLDATPIWYRGLCIPPFERLNLGGRHYRQSLAATRETLLAAGYPARDCASHCNFRIDSADAPVVRRLAAESTAPFHERGLDLGSMFCNVRAMRQAPLPWKYRPDLKLDRFDADAVATGQFSIDDAAFADPAFVSYMETQFGSPCRFES